MPKDRVIPDEVFQVSQHILQRWSLSYHLVGDAGQLGDEWRDAAAGIEQRFPLRFHPLSIKTDCPDLQDGVFLRIEAGGFDIQGDDGGHGMIIPYP